MFNIAIYLEKFKVIGSENLLLKDYVIDSIENIIKIKINKDCVIFKKNTVFFKVNQAVKSEIFINKNKITEELGFKKIFIKNIF